MTKRIQITTIKQAEQIVGGFSKPSKMPGYCLSLSASRCNMGSKLRKVADSICSDCYACKGRYVFPGTKAAHERRFKALSHPQWIDAMVFAINKRATKYPEFRWHDSGDLQSLEHLEAIALVAGRTSTVKHWLPTKEYKVVRQYIKKYGGFPPNLCVRLSALTKGKKASWAGSAAVDLPTSTVDAFEGFRCPVENGEQTCDTHGCRACWEKSVANVDYRAH